MFFKKNHKRFGYMTLLQCEKKPLYSTTQYHRHKMIEACARVIARARCM